MRKTKTKRGDGGDDKVAKPPEVDFEEGAEVTRPDNQVDPSAWYFDASKLRTLGEMAMHGFKDVYTTPEMDNIRGISEDIKYFLPYVVKLKADQIGLWKVEFDCPRDRAILIGRSIYGDDFMQTGIAERLELDDDGNVFPEEFKKFFPKCRDFLTLIGSYVKNRKDPYFALFDVPFQARSFFTGVLEKNPQLRPNNYGIDSIEICQPIDVSHAIEFAKEIGQLSNVHAYMEMYNQ